MVTAVVTGASKGIGLELTFRLVERGVRVHAACRRTSPELSATGANVIEDIEVTDPLAVARLAQALGVERIDILVNNAGVFHDDTLETLDPAHVRHQFEVNALGPLMITRALLALLGPGSRVAIITSRMGSVTDNATGGYYGYRMSKAAVNIAGVNLARELKDRGIIVLLLHPGMVATSMTEGQGIPVAEAVANLLERIDAATMADSGSFQHANGKPLPW